MANVVLKNLTKVFSGNVVAVDKVNLEIKDREFIVLVGPSGCGKSTTLRMVAGLEEITEGEVYIEDRLVNDVPPKDRDIAMVFQNYALYPHMTVYKNMAFGLKLRKYPKDEIKKAVDNAADILGITDLLDRKPKALSGGQRQRVALGRAIVRNPKVFLFDEPLSNLDAKLRVQMRTEISKLHDRLEATIIYVTHDQIEAMTMGDRIVVMKDGLIQQVDSPLNLYDNPANKFVAGFIGSPPMNFMEGKIANDNGQLVFDEGNFKLHIPDAMKSELVSFENKDITFGVRPEGLEIAEGEVPAGSKFDAKVEVIEPMGNEQYLYLTTGKHPFTARFDAHIHTEVDQTLPLMVDLEKVHFFSTEDEKVII
jgi:multiple sugar transport system ATP-binding protein